MPLGSPVDLILCDAQAATGAGSGVIGFGQEIRYAKAAGVNRNKYPKKFRVSAALTDSTTGATATLAIQHCDDAATWVTIASMPLSLVAGSQLGNSRKIFSTTKKYVRGNVTALTGGSAPKVDAYLSAGTLGS